LSFNILVRNPGSEVAGLLEREFEELPYELLCPGVEDFDWSNRSLLDCFFQEQAPSIVVNLLPDSQPQLHRDQELSAASALASVCAERSIPLIQLSSYISLGDAYHADGVAESLQPSPDKSDASAQFYLSLEKSAADNSQHLVLRLPWKIDLGDDCLLAVTASSLIHGEPLAVSSYFRGAAITKTFLVQVLAACIKQVLCGAENWGVFNLRSGEYFSEAEFVDAFSRLLQQEFDVDSAPPEISDAEGGQRLMKGSANLQAERLTNNFGILFPSWRLGFKNSTRTWLRSRGYDLNKFQ